MNQQIKRRIRQLLVIITLLSVIPGFFSIKKIYAFDSSQRGSFTLTLQEITEDGSSRALPNIKLKLYQVGTIQNDGTLSFRLVSALESTEVDFSKLTTAGAVMDAAQKLSDAVDASGIPYTEQITDESGIAVFDGLEQGMYLIIISDTSSSVEMSPMLLSVPYADETGNWLFDVKAYPKVIEPAPTQPPEPSITPDATVTPEPSVTPDATVTPEPSVTPDATVTPEPSITPDATVTPEPSVTPDATVTPEPSVTPDATVTPEPSVTPDAAVTPSPTDTPSVTEAPGQTPAPGPGDSHPNNPGPDSDTNNGVPDSHNDKNQLASNAQTGDNSPVALLALLLETAGIICILILHKKYRSRRER